MISVPNRQLLLNGSKMIFLLIISSFLWSCSSTKDAPRSRPNVIKPSKETEKDSEVLAMDTIRWVEEPMIDTPPISNDMEESNEGPFEKEYKNEYQVVLLMPFKNEATDSYNNISANNEKYAHFYAGLKMALGDIEDTKINVTTLSTDRRTDNIDEQIRRLNFLNPDVIVGPFESKALAEISAFAKDNQIPLISPWKANTRITKDNLFYLQMRPNPSSYYDAIIADMTKHFDRKNIRVIANANGNDRGRISYIQKANEQQSGLPIVEPLEVIEISEDTLLMSDSLVFDDVFEEGANVFFLPQYIAAESESFIYECLRKLNAERGNRELYVYAMPLAMSTDKIDLNILKNINLRVCEYKFVDERNMIIQKFKKNYFEKYGWIPDDEAYFGYDIMRFIGYGLQKYGKYFHYYLKDEKLNLSQMDVTIEPYYNSKDELVYLMNGNLYIIEYQDEHFSIMGNQ